MRKYYRENSLSEYWVDKLLSINFNFEGKIDNWLKSYNKLKIYVEKYQNLPDTKSSLYIWTVSQVNKYKDDILTLKQKQLLNQINIIELYENSKYQRSWESWYEDVKAFYELTNKLPTVGADKQLGSWLQKQRACYKKGELNQEQIEKLETLGMVWDTQKVDTDRWNERFEEVKVFYELNNRFPSFYGLDREKALYAWCQTQRMKQAGSNEKYKPLSTWQVEKLESIGFDFQPRGEKSLEEVWEEKYQELNEYCKQNSLSSLPSMINGEPFLLYRWLFNQKVAFKKGKLLKEREEKLLNLGVSFEFEGTLTVGKQRNSSAWYTNYEKLKAFLQANNNKMPQANRDKEQTILYGFCYNNRKKYEAGELDDEKVELLKAIKVL